MADSNTNAARFQLSESNERNHLLSLDLASASDGTSMPIADVNILREGLRDRVTQLGKEKLILTENAAKVTAQNASLTRTLEGRDILIATLQRESNDASNAGEIHLASVSEADDGANSVSQDSVYDQNWARNPSVGETLADIDRELYTLMEDRGSAKGSTSAVGTPSVYSINTRVSADAATGQASADAAPAASTTGDADADARSSLFRSLKQPTTLKFPKFPSVTQLSEWNVNVVMELLTASQEQDELEIKWFREIVHKSFDELAVKPPERFRTLDRLIGTYLHKSMPAKLKRQVKAKQIKLLKENKTLYGRQICKFMYDSFKTENHMTTVYGYNHLYELEWYGDERIEEFSIKFIEIIDNLNETISDEAKCDILYKKMKLSKVLAEDLAHYRRQSVNKGADFTLDFLMDSMDRHVQLKQEEENVEAQNADLKK